MQASNLRSQAMAAQAVHAAEFDEGAERSAQALRLLTQARNAAFAEAAQGRVGLGLSMLSQALEHEPLSHDLLSDMAALLLSAGELAHAATHAYRALELTPEHGPSLYTLGFAMSGLGEYAAAKEALQSLMQGPALASLMHEAPDLLPLVQIELQRLQDMGCSDEAPAA
ncbi:hypothetical protein [Paucibacter soli]|uniref:hypothetical protein n=1 Tax=Paucibacter soli TaxID=3133433 RepID=UPI00309603F2